MRRGATTRSNSTTSGVQSALLLALCLGWLTACGGEADLAISPPRATATAVFTATPTEARPTATASPTPTPIASGELESAIAAADDEIVLSLSAGDVPPQGTIVIDDERIAYTTVTELTGSTIALGGLTRGLDGTTPASHQAGANVFFVAATPTHTPTATQTRTPTNTPTRTFTPSPTSTFTNTPVTPPTNTNTPSETPTPTQTSTFTNTNTQTHTPTPTNTTPPADTPTPTDTTPPTDTPTVTNTPTISNTPTITNTPEDTATPTNTPDRPTPVCGNGLLEPGENFADSMFGLVGDPEGTACPQDATISTCTAGDMKAFVVDFVPPVATQPDTLQVVLGYRSTVLAIPQNGLLPPPVFRDRLVIPPPPPSTFGVSDFDYAARFLIGRTMPLGEGEVFRFTFDVCEGETASAQDISCIVEGCAGNGVPVDGCTCSISDPDAPEPTQTPAPPTATPTEAATNTPVATDTAPAPTDTPTPTSTIEPTSTPIPTATPVPPTPTATATPDEPMPVCGNGLLETGERFDDPMFGGVGDPEGETCPADAVVASCTPSDSLFKLDIDFQGPVGTLPDTVTIVLPYRSDILAMPGMGLLSPAIFRSRLAIPLPLPSVLGASDFDYATRIIIGRTEPLGDGLLLSVDLDVCEGAVAAIGDATCIVEGCAGNGVPIDGCTCSVSEPDL